MTDSTAEDRPEPPPRQIEWLQFSGTSDRDLVGVEVHVAVTNRFDPYMGDTLHVSSVSPLGLGHRRHLTRRGEWVDFEIGAQAVDGGFEMPMGFGQALMNAFTGDVRRAKKETEDVIAASEAIVETYKQAANTACRAGELMTRRVEQLDQQVRELEEELDAWREGRFTTRG